MALVIGGKSKEDKTMKKQTAEFVITTDENKNITQVGRSSITQPRTCFRGGGVTWYQDKIKPEYRHNKKG